MKHIQLTNGYKAIVDDEDYEWLNKYSWQVSLTNNHTQYAVTNINGSRPPMHRIILDLQDSSILVDHINNNGLDNRKCNLRKCTPRQNSINSKPRKGCKSKYKGVSWHKTGNRWEVYISPEKGKRKYVGSSKSEVEAAKIYNKAAKKYYGEFAYLNDV